jgi:hypothetical protein
MVVILISGICGTARPQSTVLADSVKGEFLHAWNGYKKFAWGHDALKPLTKNTWYSHSLLLTPVDAFDVMYHGAQEGNG